MELYTAERIRAIACGDAIVAIVKQNYPRYDWVHHDLMIIGQLKAEKICPNATPLLPEELIALTEHNGGFTAAEAHTYSVDVDSLIRDLTTKLETSLDVRFMQYKDIDEHYELILAYPQPDLREAFVVDRAVPIL